NGWWWLFAARFLAVAARAAAASAAAAAAVAVAARSLLARLPRRGALCPLARHPGRGELPAPVRSDALFAPPRARPVHRLDEDVEHVAALDHFVDVVDGARPDVRYVQQAVGALLQLDERGEVGRLHDLAGVLVADFRSLGQRLDRGDRGVGLVALGGVDEDRAVLLDVDLHLEVGLERPDRLAALPDHHAEVVR